MIYENASAENRFSREPLAVPLPQPCTYSTAWDFSARRRGKTRFAENGEEKSWWRFIRDIVWELRCELAEGVKAAGAGWVWV